MARISPAGSQVAGQPSPPLPHYAGQASQCLDPCEGGWVPALPGGGTGTGEPLAPGLTLSHTFPATPGQVGEARRFLASQLDGSPLTADALVCLSELATNAVLHSRSARPGGQFTVRISSAPGSMRVQVIDGGGLWAPGPDGDDHGHGLMIVAALATRLHISDRGTDSPARTVTFEMSLRSPTPI